MTDLIYHEEIPSFLLPYLASAEMQRLKEVGMHCGCEYTSFSFFKDLLPYSRYRHSLGVSLITWHFAREKNAALAALFHDIATPVFAHTVDFLKGDHLKQEATEEGTEEIIRSSKEITEQLEKDGLRIEDVKDYHRYPIADNDSPRLSADRLEYSLGNFVNFGLTDTAEVKALYEDLFVDLSPEGAPELSFQTKEKAKRFAFLSLACSRVYISDPDRYSMQRLAEVLKLALEKKVLMMKDLYRTEPEVISLLEGNEETAAAWQAYRSLHRMTEGEEQDPLHARIIPAKKRFIDPLCKGERVSEWDEGYRRELQGFLASSQEKTLCAL